MTIGSDVWVDFVKRLSALDDGAKRKVENFISLFGGSFDFTDSNHMKLLIEYAYTISQVYGQAAAALACEVYDEIGLASGVLLDPAIPAELATYPDVAKAINGTAKTRNIEMMGASVGRLVKMAGTDTTMKNSIRDKAQVAWIPNGDTCAFCVALASRGWETASEDMLKNGHTKHIHGNCDCTYGVRFNKSTKYASYNPKKYEDMYYGAEIPEGQKMTSKNRINALRREFYAENKETINAQKRDAYAKRQALESPEAEEDN